MTGMPIGWDRARAAYENDCNDAVPRVCRHCPDYESCNRDWIDCEQDADATAAEARFEARRDAHD